MSGWGTSAWSLSLYHYSGTGDKRRHLYGQGDGSSSGDGSLDLEEADRMRVLAEEEAAAREESLTDEQREQRSRVMALLARLRRLRAGHKRESEKRRSEARSKGLAASVVEELGRQMEEQFSLEKAELAKQIRLEKAELERMLRGDPG